MHNEKSHVHEKNKTFFMVSVVLMNLILGFCVIFSVIVAFQNAKKASFSQNIENVRTLTDASANKLELEINHHTEEMRSYAEYINSYYEEGMTEPEIYAFFDAILLNDDTENYSWQLVDNTLNDVKGNGQGFNAVALGKTTEQFSYKAQAYPELGKIFKAAEEDTLEKITYSSEFTDASSKLMKSFAITTPVRILTENQESGTTDIEYKTLMLLITSDYLNSLLASNNEVDTLSFFDYSNVIVDNNGNYIISNNQFQGTNFLKYIELYNSEFKAAQKESLLEELKGVNYSATIYYQNNRGEDCAYTIVPIQNSDWHILSVVPLNSFHNSYDFNIYFVRFGILFLMLFLVDILCVLGINNQLRRSTREAQKANEAKSQFLSSMSHDIRTPMNAIVGMTAIADENLKEDEPDIESLRECINTIELSGKNLLTLINDILDISKIETGRIIFTPEEFSIVENMEEMFEIEEPQIEKKQLQLITNIGNIQHNVICADELRLNQIYLNILTNAVKYTNPGGTITVTLTEEPLPNEQGKGRFIYTVSDTGIGMSPEFLKTIFDRFSRAVDTRVNSIQGTGLGMAICKQLVDLMGGTIEVQSKENVGSTFTVTLEIAVSNNAMAAKRKQHKDAESERPTLDLNVLVVEDNDVNWMVIEKLLRRYQIAVERAANGQLGVTCIMNSKTPYDVVLMDIQMPVMNGYAATKMIRELKDPVRAHVPVYAMTADSYAEDVAKCMEAGMDGHLAKPLEIDKLLKILVEISDRKKKVNDTK